MKEAFLHFVWKTQSFTTSKLIGTCGREFSVIFPGDHNHNAGPDFLSAKLRIDGIIWVGSVEIHLRSSDWIRHGHHRDPTYDNTVLHAVYECDQEITRTDGTPIVHLELKGIIDPSQYARFRRLKGDLNDLPCANILRQNPNYLQGFKLEQYAHQRFVRKADEVLEKYKTQNKDWHQILFEELAKAMGGPVNREAFTELCRSLPFRVLKKHKDKRLVLEALMLGVAGFLQEVQKTDYHTDLKLQFEHRKKIYNLNEMEPTNWKYSRLRPSGFPGRRLVQLAALVPILPQLLDSKELRFKHLSEILNREVSEYWQSHYRLLGKRTKASNRLSIKMQISLYVNAILPVLLARAAIRADGYAFSRHVGVLPDFKPEHNRITRKFEALGFGNKNLMQSQALIELYTQFCSKGHCLDCELGRRMVSE